MNIEANVTGIKPIIVAKNDQSQLAFSKNMEANEEVFKEMPFVFDSVPETSPKLHDTDENNRPVWNLVEQLLTSYPINDLLKQNYAEHDFEQWEDQDEKILLRLSLKFNQFNITVIKKLFNIIALNNIVCQTKILPCSTFEIEVAWRHGFFFIVIAC